MRNGIPVICISIENIIIKIEETMLGITSFLLLATICIQIVCRYVLYIPTPWAEEIARYAFIWLSYIGGAVGVARQAHMEMNLMDSIIERFVKTNNLFAKKCLFMTSIIVTCLFLVLFSVIYWTFFKRIIFFTQRSPSAGINMLYPMAAVLVGTVLMIYHGVNRLLFPLGGKRVLVSENSDNKEI